MIKNAMNNSCFYFAYGSNMASERLMSRVSSATRIDVAVLERHQLKFHKISRRDGSGKCDAAYTGSHDDKVFGVLYSIQSNQLSKLDNYEGLGSGYERNSVIVLLSASGEQVSAEAYFATAIDSNLRPFDWYKEHVLRGATSAGLPSDYIAWLRTVVADTDTDEKRRSEELAVYDEQT